MTARDRFKVGDRVRVAAPPRGKRGPCWTGVVVEPWPQAPTLVRVRRDTGRVTVDGSRYWTSDECSHKSA